MNGRARPLSDTAVPPGVRRPPAVAATLAGVPYLARRWTADHLAALLRRLDEDGSQALAELPRERLLDAWAATVEALRDPSSSLRRRLDPGLTRLARLSPAGLDAGLEAVLGGGRRGVAERLFEEAEGGATGGAPVAIFLASNLPALAVQPLLPALAARRAVLLKSPGAEPLFAPAFVAALGRREPRGGRAGGAGGWPGGDAVLEAPVLAGVATVLAYGGAAAMDDLARRAGAKLVAYGPKLSLAAVARGASAEAVAPGLARDVALFDQRGCLSIQAVYVDGGAAAAERLAGRLAAELAALAETWPPGPPTLAELAAVRQLRAEAELRGLCQPPLPLAAGTVVVDPEPALRPSPGCRTVRLHPLDDLARLPALLAPWRGRLQGVALAGDAPPGLAAALAALGVSRLTPPGELQTPDAAWHNGGVSPLAALARHTGGA